jgi:hypothetical protein
MTRRAARVDDNQPDVVEGLRAAGCRVHVTSMLGQGFPDLLVGAPWGQLFLVEVKDPAQPANKQRLTVDEAEWHRHWHRYPVLVATSAGQALQLMCLRRR